MTRNSNENSAALGVALMAMVAGATGCEPQQEQVTVAVSGRGETEGGDPLAVFADCKPGSEGDTWTCEEEINAEPGVNLVVELGEEERRHIATVFSVQPKNNGEFSLMMPYDGNDPITDAAGRGYVAVSTFDRATEQDVNCQPLWGLKSSEDGEPLTVSNTFLLAPYARENEPYVDEGGVFAGETNVYDPRYVRLFELNGAEGDTIAYHCMAGESGGSTNVTEGPSSR